MRTLEPWTGEWSLDDIFVGQGGQGAGDGAIELALKLEVAKITGMVMSGGACDLYKCFDQIVRPLVYKILAIAGCPPKVIDAYRRFVDFVQVHNTIAGGYGRPT